MTPPSARRRDVLDLRIRLERAAAAAFRRCCRGGSGRQSNIRVRLLFVVGLVAEAEQPSALRLARLGAHVYARTSDVLHGRVRALDVEDALVAEWRGVVEGLERLVTASPAD